MAMHAIQVDDEVLAHLKERAEPFVDTPNSVLRRELLAEGRRRPLADGSNSGHTGNIVPLVRAGTPQALTQLLQVAYLVTQKGINRPEATRVVARFHGVAPQTVNDKYGRQAHLDASRFDQLLAEPGLMGLRSHVRERFPQHGEVIDELLCDKSPGIDATPPSPAGVTSGLQGRGTGIRLNRKPLTQTTAGYLRGRAPKGDMIVVWHQDEGRTGYHLHWNGQWHERFGQAEMEGKLGISVRAKKSGSQEGYPAEAVVHAAWRYLVDRYIAGDANVEYSRVRPADLSA